MLPASPSSLYFPMTIDVYYSTQTQSALGTIQNEWVYDRTVNCSAVRPQMEQMSDFLKQSSRDTDNAPKVNLRTLAPVTVGTDGTVYRYSEVMLTNLKTASGVSLWNEDASTPTRFELESVEPIADGFGEVFGYRSLIVRSLDQS